MYRIIVACLSIGFAFSFAEANPRTPIEKETKPIEKCVDKPSTDVYTGKTMIWTLPKTAENITIYYKDPKGRIVFSRTLSVDGDYKLEMVINENN